MEYDNEEFQIIKEENSPRFILSDICDVTLYDLKKEFRKRILNLYREEKYEKIRNEILNKYRRSDVSKYISYSCKYNLTIRLDDKVILPMGFVLNCDKVHIEYNFLCCITINCNYIRMQKYSVNNNSILSVNAKEADITIENIKYIKSAKALRCSAPQYNTGVEIIFDTPVKAKYYKFSMKSIDKNQIPTMIVRYIDGEFILDLKKDLDIKRNKKYTLDDLIAIVYAEHF